eukprot:2992701-Pleurochrysis_carterae.AAC.1
MGECRRSQVRRAVGARSARAEEACGHRVVGDARDKAERALGADHDALQDLDWVLRPNGQGEVAQRGRALVRESWRVKRKGSRVERVAHESRRCAERLES